MSKEATYRPSAFYFRRALRRAKDKDAAVAVGLTVVTELEGLKAWVRDRGLVPPKRHLLVCEIEEKGWNA